MPATRSTVKELFTGMRGLVLGVRLNSAVSKQGFVQPVNLVCEVLGVTEFLLISTQGDPAPLMRDELEWVIN